MQSSNKLQQTWLVTTWEFMHFFKWKQEVISKLIMIGIALVVLLWQYIKDEQAPHYTIAIHGSDIALSNSDSFTFITAKKPLTQLKVDLVDEEKLNAILSLKVNEQGVSELTVLSKDKQAWLADLQHNLHQQFSLIYADNLGLAPEQLMVLKQPVTFKNHYLDTAIKADDSPAKTTAIGMILLLAVGVFTSFGQLFISVTGEKQQRVTEQLYSRISPQTWIDGKILGQMLHALKAMVTATITASLGYAFATVIISGNPLDFSMIDWTLLPWLLLFAIAGVYLCTAFMAAIAAAIDDPNHSAKTSIMLLPLLPMVISFITMDSASGWALTFLSYFPITSFVAMPVRMSLIELPIWQPILSLALILALCLWIRTAAARLFKMGMTMYGKEPSMKDMLKWTFKES
ncbi:ABC transporter permease [Litorilituus lipolyticus]|uniref:ABC transporter permease n=1 Tax=Litorilituus lipolyticus TaxID=2491017 RepID=A0A502L281_9GAMM|nr:ABC transporter permease [Litorilituus lipolyticus]TPH16103.1 ABC transporter permease [Litorilituus lipolyticus]